MNQANQTLRRRDALKYGGAATLALGLSKTGLASSPNARTQGANSDLRVAIIGIGSDDAVGGVGGRGRQLIGALLKVPGVRIVGLCDVDQSIVQQQAGELKNQGQSVETWTDMRRVFDDKSIDAVIVATPNHWHALATIWACQAGKDVYVEKPVSYNIWEGRQMVAAARKHDRIVQAGTQARSSSAMQQAIEWVQRGELGPIRYARIIVYRQRSGIGKVVEPTPIASGIDYDLWCGPTGKVPLMRKQLHYDWHWDWSTGSGEMGNNGVHYIDMCRWALKLDAIAPRVMSLGGRFGFEDDGQTPNTQVAILDYHPAPIYVEVRSLTDKKGSQRMDSFLDTKMGLILQCEGGYFTGAHLHGSVFDNQGKKIKEFGPIPWADMDIQHLSNFVDATRSREVGDLNADILEGHRSAACCHMVNISHRLGKPAAQDAALERVKSDPTLSDAVDRYRQHLKANEIEFGMKEVLGPWVTLDTQQERFVGEFADDANEFLTRKYREPFVVPQTV